MYYKLYRNTFPWHPLVLECVTGENYREFAHINLSCGFVSKGNVAKNLPVIRIKDIPYESFPIDCSTERLNNYLTSKGYYVTNDTPQEYTGDSIVFYCHDEFIVRPMHREDFVSIREVYPERVIYLPEQLVLD